MALDSAQVKADLKERDKYPNIDGYLELVDDHAIPVGKLEVQVRKIPTGATKYQCPTSLFAYTTTTALPVLLVCVDTTREMVYWKHLKGEDILGKESQDSISISFENPEDVVSCNTSYYNKWLLIARDYCERIRRFDALQQIARKATPLIGQKSEEVKKIQIFIDELNGLLDGSYACLKRGFFPGVWKIGLGLQGWSDECVQYLLFAIEEGRNEPLIKQIEAGLDILQIDPDIGFYSYFGKNRLAQYPKNAARELVLDRMKTLIRLNGLSIRTDILARESLFDFIDSHHECLGVVKQNLYEAPAIYHAFHEYFPRWCDAARRIVSDYRLHIPYFDPVLAQVMIGKSIAENVNTAVNNKLPFSPVTIGSSQISYRQIRGLVEFARATGKPVERLYRRPTYRGTGPWIWSDYSNDDALFNVRVIFENFGDVYRRFVELNGMDYEVLKPFSNTSKLVIFYDPSKIPDSGTPRIWQYQLTSKDEPVGTPLVQVFPGTGPAIKRDGSGHPIVELEGKSYRVESHSVYEASFVFQRTPMLTLVYETLEKKLDVALGSGVRY